MSIISAEFTVEPFEPADPGPHVLAAIEAANRGATDDIEVEVGPFGTAITGPTEAVLQLVDEVNRAAITNGATRVSLQISTQ